MAGGDACTKPAPWGAIATPRYTVLAGALHSRTVVRATVSNEYTAPLVDAYRVNAPDRPTDPVMEYTASLVFTDTASATATDHCNDETL